MKTLTLGLMLSSLLFSQAVLAQVDAIKSASSGNSGSHSGSSDYSDDDGSDSELGFVLIDVFFTKLLPGVASWQQLKLEKKKVNPTVISFDVMLQSAIQPSSYYILNPRVRANWGLFSTDFRFTYLVEEDIEGYKHLRTDDWQILQLNIVTTRNVIARIGGGILHENFSGGKTFGEGTLGIHLQSNSQRLGGMIEYRWSEPRNEWNAQAQFRVFQSKAFNGYFTAGIVHQRYYDTVTAWGLQGGFMLRIF
ncbi:MAG TPA: hypothetical protein VGK59_19370 [Ohtaekwangia sp.]